MGARATPCAWAIMNASRIAAISISFSLIQSSHGAVLISNLISTSSFTSVGANCNRDTYRVMKFTTPPYSTQLTTVRAVVAYSTPPGLFPTVEFRTGVATNSAGTVQHVMIPPASPQPIGVLYRVFTTSGFTFQPSTSYWVTVRHTSSLASGGWYRSDANSLPTGLATYGNSSITYNNGALFTVDSLRPMVEINVADLTQTISGSLTLNDTSPSFAVSRTMTYTVKQGTTTVQTGTVASSASTSPFSFTLPTSYSGAATLIFDGYSFLRKSVNINLAGTATAVGSVVLSNGDADASGEVDAADIDAVIADFAQTNSANTDVDVSGEVDAGDIDIVISNFGETDN